jgi:hypothetical protein
MRTKKIAAKLNPREHAVCEYLFRIFDKLGISSLVEAVLNVERGMNLLTVRERDVVRPVRIAGLERLGVQHVISRTRCGRRQKEKTANSASVGTGLAGDGLFLFQLQSAVSFVLFEKGTQFRASVEETNPLFVIQSDRKAA